MKGRETQRVSCVSRVGKSVMKTRHWFVQFFIVLFVLSFTKIIFAAAATGQSVSTNEDISKSITLTGSGSGRETLTYSLVTQPAHGSATLSGSRTVLYAPSSNYNGADSFTFKVTGSSSGASSPATVSITVNAVNDPPTASGTSVSTNEDTSIDVNLAAYVADIDSSNLSCSVSGNSHGTASVVSGCKIRFTPATHYVGAASFNYKAYDGAAYSTSATVTVTVNATNVAPVANSASMSINEDTAGSVTLSATDSDNDAMTYSIVSNPAHGNLTSTGAKSYLYAPAANYNGSDSFTFHVYDGTTYSNNATISISINPMNDPPVANAASVSVNAGGSVDIVLTGSDIDGDSLTYTTPRNPTIGTLSSLSNTNQVTYTPNSDITSGTDSFLFAVNDGTVANSATVSITIVPVPMAMGSYVTVAQNGSADIYLLGTLDGQLDSSFTCATTTTPVHGSLRSTSSSCHKQYTPSADYFGTDSFDFIISNGTITSEPATLHVNVMPPTGYADRPKVQVGVNWVPYYSTNGSDPTPFLVNTLTPLLNDLGMQSVRQIGPGDLLRSNVQAGASGFDFSLFDQLLVDTQSDELIPIFTFGAYLFASCTPDFNKDSPNPSTFVHYPDAACTNYMQTTTDHVAQVNPSGRPFYGELANEMFHWVAYDSTINFTYDEQSIYVDFVSKYVSQIPHVIRVAPSIMVGDNGASDWRDGVMVDENSAQAADHYDPSDFDIETIHEYGEWQPYRTNLIGFQRTPEKLLYLTETGETRDPNNTYRTSGNSPELQAASLWIRSAISYGAGVSFMAWHPFYDSDDGSENYNGFGPVGTDGFYYPLAYAYQHMTDELIPFTEVTDLSQGDNGIYNYRYVTDAGEVKYVIWGSGTTTVPTGVSRMASVVPDSSGNMNWQTVSTGSSVVLQTETPYLFK